MSDVKERPIALTAQEVLAVVAGDKTQHRVIIENTESTQCLFNGDWRYDGRDFLDNDGCIPDPKGAHYIERLNQDGLPTEDYRCIGHCPFGAIGDRLWVQEPSLIHCDWDWFYADNTLVECKEPFTPNDLHLPWDDENQEYKGPIGGEFLPRWASRLLLEITDIRIEGVKDIKLRDAVAEACFKFPENFRLVLTPLVAFSNCWMERHGDESWNRNDWVWVIEFKVIKEI